MVKLQNMPQQQRIVMGLVFTAVIIFGLLGICAPKGSFLAWKTQQFLPFTPGLLLGYLLGVWVGQNSRDKRVNK